MHVDRLKSGLAAVLALWALELLAATVVPVPAALISMVLGAVLVTLLASVRSGAGHSDAEPLIDD